MPRCRSRPNQVLISKSKTRFFQSKLAHRRTPCRSVGHSAYRDKAAQPGETTMDKIKPLFTATATETGGRNGHTESSDAMIKADLSVPQAMGGPGRQRTATPEHHFAADYAACFGGALDYVAKQQRKDATKAKVTCAVTIGPREGGGFGLAVKLHIEDKSIPQADLAALAKEAHEKICPYSHATRGNVEVSLEVAGDA